ncbi:MAG: hypothetical protein KAR16_13760 [Bacteroidales bacterium]|nr:hypothetical protein [Bacteroidales bacterium]
MTVRLLLVILRFDGDFGDKLTVPVSVVKNHRKVMIALHLHIVTRHHTFQDAGFDKSDQALHINVAFLLVTRV